ncbi:MAG: hypothetical protein E7600_06555 [Ruminococcaceae bacterium]|nr:hypothetical protein [Oscillospiraceae bacterium]
MKRVFAFALVLATVVCLAICTNAMKFTDVPESAWYYEDVKGAVETGIVNGKSDTEYKPNDNLTYAEAIKLAACMHQFHMEGNISINGGTPWYMPYVEYCVDNDIFSQRKADRYVYNDNATRSGYMEIFANALPDYALEEINYVPDDSIPDVPSSKSYADAVYKLYRAGILQGVDAEHNCKPDDNIRRSEVAAIVTRMMNADKRVSFGIGEGSEPENEPENETEKEPDKEPEKEPEEPEEPKVDDSEVVETPDMYPELSVIGQPVYKQNADEGETVYYWTVADGGKEPYSYRWYRRDVRYGDEALEDGEYIGGTGTDTLEFTFSLDNPYLEATFYCEVTDALGSKVQSNRVKTPEPIFVGVVDPESFTEYQDGFILVTRVGSGSLKKGQAVFLYSESLGGFYFAYVDRMEMFKKELDEATTGNNVGLLFKDLLPEDFDLLTETYGKETVDKLLSQHKNFVVKAPLNVYQKYKEVYANGYDEVEIEAFAIGGRQPYTYEWQISLVDENDFNTVTDSNGMNLWGIDESVLTIPAVNYLHYTLEWRCLVTDADGNTAYAPNATRIMPIEDVRFYKIPYDIYAEYGETVQFTAKALATDGIKVVDYQWEIKTDNHKDFVEIEAVDTWARGYDTTTLELDVDMSMFQDHARVRCVVTDSRGKKLVSAEARILPKSVYITKHPVDNITLSEGVYGAEFDLKAEGGKEPYTYTWQIACNETDGEFVDVRSLEGDDGVSSIDKISILSVTAHKFKYTGDIRFRCIVQDATGRKVTSKEARLRFETPASVSLEKRGIPKDETIVILG